MISTQTMSKYKMQLLYQKMMWQNSREIVLYTVLAQLLIIGLLSTEAATPWMKGFNNLTIRMDYYDLQVPLLFACMSAFWFGKHIKRTSLMPFHFPKQIVVQSQSAIVWTYTIGLSIALILEKYVMGIIVISTKDYDWSIPMTNNIIDFLFVLVSIYTIINAGRLYTIKPTFTISIGIMSIMWAIFISQKFYQQRVQDWLLSLQWSNTQYEVLRLALLLGPITLITLCMAFFVMRKERH